MHVKFLRVIVVTTPNFYLEAASLSCLVIVPIGKQKLIKGRFSAMHLNKWINESNFLCLQYRYQQKEPTYIPRYFGFKPKVGSLALHCLQKPSIVLVCAPVVGST